MPMYDQQSMISLNTGIILSILGVSLVSIGGYFFYRARQYASKALAEKIINEGGPYVLYLRPFKSDSTLSTSRKSFQPTTVYQNLQSTMEEDLFKVLEPFGNLIAIGKPGEKLPTPGAARIYVSEEWKDVVIEKMKGSQLVIIYAGTGEGLNWELKQAFEIIDLKKFLIFIPTMSKKIYESFRKTALEKLGVLLPERSELKGPKRRGVYTGFIRFSKDKIPCFLPLYAPLFRVNPYSPYQARFTYALKPLFEDFGLEWHLPPIVKGYIVSLIVMGSILLLIIVLLILDMLGKI
jgi:hypothetical protein